MRSAAALIVAAQVLALGQGDDNQLFPPHRIAGNLYYVGSSDIAVYLVTSKRGHALINAGYTSTPAIIDASMEQLGFHLRDVKYLLNSQAHIDHVGGMATLDEMTDYALVWASAADAEIMEGGGHGDFRFDGIHSYPPVYASNKFRDGETLTIGDTTLVAHITPGHTKGCTTWTLQVKEGGRTYDVVIVGGTGINEGVRLVGNLRYPRIAADYAWTFRLLRALPCDIFLGAHGSYYGLKEKYERFKKGDKNAFVDPQGYKDFIDRAEKAYRDQLAAEAKQK